jgi:hypothetical protein
MERPVDQDAREDAGKATMASARYRPGQMGGRSCAKCVHFVRDADPQHGDCTVVAGEILGRMLCDWFEAGTPQQEKADAA